jgi:hypothetical protein
MVLRNWVDDPEAPHRLTGMIKYYKEVQFTAAGK